VRTIHWQLTFACNLRCRYCWNETRARPAMGLPERRARQVLDEIAAAGESQVLFTGGEPLLVPNLPALLEHGRDLDLPLTLFTNASLLDEAWIERLMRLARPGRFMLVVSLDTLDRQASGATRGDPRPAVAALERLAALGATSCFPVMLNTVLTAATIDGAGELLAFAVQHRVCEHRLDLGILHPRESYPPELDLAARPAAELDQRLDHLVAAIGAYREQLRLLPVAYYEEMRTLLRTGQVPPFPCGAGGRLLVIGPQGEVRPCFERGPVLADLRRQPFARALRAAMATALQDEIARQACLSPRCFCSFLRHPHRIPPAPPDV
jgi:MoaA/NifB/PqqE/SkfB family radical SAM enzyme